MSLTKGIVYVADHDLPNGLAESCQQQLLRSGLYILSVSLKPIAFGDNISLGLEPGPLTVFKQILAGVANVQEDVAFICAAHIWYHPSHFEFTPPNRDKCYYNRNVLPGSRVLWLACAHTIPLADYYGLSLKRFEHELASGRDVVGLPRSEPWCSPGPNISHNV